MNKLLEKFIAMGAPEGSTLVVSDGNSPLLDKVLGVDLPSGMRVLIPSERIQEIDGHTLEECLHAQLFPTERADPPPNMEFQNPKVVEGLKKTRFDLLNPVLTDMVAQVLTYGANKYGDRSYLGHGDLEENIAGYQGALERHFNALRQEELVDPASKLPHVAHIIANAQILFELDLANTQFQPGFLSEQINELDE